MITIIYCCKNIKKTVRKMIISRAINILVIIKMVRLLDLVRK